MSTVHFNNEAYVNKDIFHYPLEKIGEVFVTAYFTFEICHNLANTVNDVDHKKPKKHNHN